MKYMLLFLAVLVSSFMVFAQSAEPESLDVAINSPYNEMNPILHPDGKSLYFTRANHPDNMGGRKDKGDIWVSVLGGNGWETAKNIGQPINNTGFNAVIGFSDDGKKMFLHNIYSKGSNSSIAQGVSVSQHQGNSWSFPEPVRLNSFYNKSDHQSISISPDGRIMMMAIESYGSYGAEDIYVSFQRSNGEWTDPLNIGPDINTRFQEMTPTLLKDNKTLVFASNGHDGIGSFDLFYSERLDDTWMKWSKPQSMGNVINTRGREMYYSVSPDEEYAYFISTQNSEGYGDVKRVRLKQDDLAKQVEQTPTEPEPIEIEVAEEMELHQEEPVVEKVESPRLNQVMVEGKIVNVKNHEVVPGKIILTQLGSEHALELQDDGSSGTYKVMLQPGRYNFKASAMGFMTLEEEINVSSGAQVLIKNFELSPLDVGSTFRLNNVLFNRGTTDLLETSFPELDKVVELLMENPTVKIELSGHTDNQGVARVNLKLSQDRVEVVKQYIVQKGIESGRISGKGYGSSQPIASNNNEETRQLNRRVEFTILQN